ncbi:capsule assembly Wzi family protein [Piscinibacter aquaticus]|uniref:Capsule assembly Wzi family protein n=1 Tax=Piscinibacter aquaticus TaxID=392597 RepID=A0A5C6U264_9BURK|nr:capsule assembly Wzi family protein [Piscinibacter aquaticus]
MVMVVDDSDARDCSLHAPAQGLPKVTACGLLHTLRVRVRAMPSSVRPLALAAVMASAAPALAAERSQLPLFRDSATLEALDGQAVQRAALTLAAANDAASPNLLGLPLQGRSGASLLLSGGEADGWRWQLGGSVRLQDGQGADLEGSGLSVPLGPGRAYASVERRHWGPSPFGSLILDGSARALPAIGWRKTSAQPFDWRGLSWLGPWRTDAFAGRLDNDAGPGVSSCLAGGWRSNRCVASCSAARASSSGAATAARRPSAACCAASRASTTSNRPTAAPNPATSSRDSTRAGRCPGAGRGACRCTAGRSAKTRPGTCRACTGQWWWRDRDNPGRWHGAALVRRAGRHDGRPPVLAGQAGDGLPAPAVSGRLCAAQRAAGASGRARRAAGLGRSRAATRRHADACDGAPRQRRAARSRRRVACRRGQRARAGPAASEWRDAAGRVRSLQLRVEVPLNDLR